MLKFQWKFSASKQLLTAPSGHSITVREIATWLQDRVHTRYDLTGPWAGWRIRGKVLKGPRGQSFTPDSLRHVSEEAPTPYPPSTPQVDRPSPEPACNSNR